MTTTILLRRTKKDWILNHVLFASLCAMLLMASSPPGREQRNQFHCDERYRAAGMMEGGGAISSRTSFGFFLFADAASACVCKAGNCNWDDLVPENAAAGDTCDIEPVDGVITANILCEDSETNANSVQPTEIFLTSRNFDRFSGDIILYKCSTLTTFEMSDGSPYNLTGKIEITQNDALESVYIYQLEEIIGLFDLSANPVLERVYLQSLLGVSQFIKIVDNGGSSPNGGIESLDLDQLDRVGENGPETFYFDSISDAYVTSNNNAWSLANTSYAYTSGAAEVAIEIKGNTFRGDYYVGLYFSSLTNVRGDLKFVNNVNLYWIRLQSLRAVWGQMLIEGNTRWDNSEEYTYIDSFCKYSYDTDLGDTLGVKSVLIDAYVPTPNYYTDWSMGNGGVTTDMIDYIEFTWTPINQVVASYQTTSTVLGTQGGGCYATNAFDTLCTSHASCGYSHVMEQEMFCGSKLDYQSGSYSYECSPCVQCVRNQYLFSQVEDVSNPDMWYYAIDGSCPGKCVYVPPSPPPAESPPPYNSITDNTFSSAITSCLEIDPVYGNCEESGYGPISYWDVSAVTNMTSAFSEKSSFNGDLKNWDTSSVTDMTSMFYNAFAFRGTLIYTWNVSNVESMADMFNGAVLFDGRLKEWDVSSVTTMEGMFGNCNSFDGDLSGWSTGNVVKMNGMFYNTASFGSYFESLRFETDPDIVWDTSSVIDMSSMFESARSLTSVPFNGMCPASRR